jgi:hypothetical protein
MGEIEWNKIKVHCSSISNIMASNGGVNGFQVWQDAIAEREKKQADFDKLKNKQGARGEGYLARLDELDLLIPELEKQKDIPEPLSKGCKTFLSGVYAYEKYHKWSPNKDIGSKHTEKGKEVEADAISLVSVLDGVLLYKNEERVEDDHFSGLPDAFQGDNLLSAEIIHDVKCPWDIETYFSYLGKELPSNYYWQMQGYMAITGAKIAKIHFCMVNTPEHQIKDASDRLLRRMNVISELSPEFIKAQKELYNNMTFDDIPLNERRLLFTVERNDEDIEKARKRVVQCREYLAEFEKMHLESSKILSLHQIDAI